MQYRRFKIKGGCYFFTVVTYKRNKIFAEDKNVDMLRQAIKVVRKSYPFTINAMVVLPDHLHAIFTLPEGDANYVKRWSYIKSLFTRGFLLGQGPTYISCARMKKRERAVWQRRYWEHAIRNELDYQRHVDYIHYN